MDRSMARLTLASALESRGFEMERPLVNSLHSSIYCVREIPGSFTAAKESSTGPYVAKVVSLGGLDAQGRASALQEVSVLRGIASHPNLIQYRDSFLEEAAGVLLIVMSFAESGDLRNAVANAQALRTPLPEPAILCWLRQMVAGLGHLHSQGVVHRDLKSSNIFLCDGMSHIRIGDFGISKVLESTDFAQSCVGTPAYMSPELMRNERYDYHVDMWALGCVCYELCTLRLPFVTKSLLDLVHLVVQTEPDWAVWEHSYCQDVRQLAPRLLQKDAAGRPTAPDLLSEPLFASGLPTPGAEVWNAIATDKRTATSKEQAREEATRFSEASTADTAEDLLRQSGSDTWTLTPRMSWEKGRTPDGDIKAAPRSAGSTDTRLTQTVPSGFGRILAEAHDTQRQLSKCEFQDLLSTHSSQLQLDISSISSSGYIENAEAPNKKTEAPILQYQQAPKARDRDEPRPCHQVRENLL